ncbi:FGGY-family carbohydrate kinase [Lactiplantibacillus daowaiensis]|uniref:FGGY-family carbohydrate kinase n=1 Tax=Lactiplantibacillus daowaiensis TaxID=2559918 RepID=A0ABW1S0Z2_9LACO|nr:FGGY-family carbohydrate kinase [Lactiplantibacillus daowaiensis]
MAKYLMGIDNGGTSSKAAIYDINGNEVAKHTTYTQMLTPHQYWTERDMNELKQVNYEAIRGALKKAAIDPRDIVGISCTGHGNGLYLMGHNGSVVRNGIISTDNRAHKIVDKWLADPAYETIVRPRTFQTVWSSQPVSLLKWLDENEPDVYDQTEYVFMITDLVRYWLTGQAGFELSNASGTSMINQHTEDYDEQVFDFFGIDHWLKKMPKLVKSDKECGQITDEVAKETGLAAGTPVAGGLFDITASALSTGLVAGNNLSIVTGTWSINQYISKEIKVIKDLFMTSDYPIDGYHLITEASPTSGSNLTWFINTFMKPVKARLKKEGNQVSIYDYCSGLVNEVEPADSKLIFFPFIFGSNAGVANATAGFVGATKGTSLAEFVRAVYEGVVFAHMAHCEKLDNINPNIDGPIRIAGGITNSEIWLQIFADVFQRPLELVDVSENGALGTSMAAAVMSGVYPDFATAADKMVKISRTVQPNPDNAKIYQQKYALYKKELQHMQGAWETLEDTELV